MLARILCTGALGAGYGGWASSHFLHMVRRKFAASEGRHPFTGGLN